MKRRIFYHYDKEKINGVTDGWNVGHEYCEIDEEDLPDFVYSQEVY